MGNPQNRPTIKAASNFSGDYLIYGKDPGQPSTTNFYIGMKNIILDSTSISNHTSFTLLDWSVSQATQLSGVVFNMPPYSSHTGIAMPEGGSGTMIGNLDFFGGACGINFNNQQYLLKDLTFQGVGTAINVSHAFDLVVQNAKFVGCGVAIDSMNADTMGSLSLLDSVASGTATIINGNATNVGAITIENFVTSGSNSTVTLSGSVLKSGSIPDTWTHGTVYQPPTPGSNVTGTSYSTSQPARLSLPAPTNLPRYPCHPIHKRQIRP